MIKKLLQNPWLYTILIGVIFILPFIIIAYYTYPSADDFCRVNLIDGYWTTVYNWYMHHNGRFFNAIIATLPVYNFSFYWLLAIFFICFLGATTHYMLKQALAPLGWSKELILPISTAFLALIMVKLPTHGQFFYWYAASSVYVLGLGLNLLIIGVILKMAVAKEPSWKEIRMPVIAAFCANGCHEMAMAHVVGFLLAATFISLFFAQKRKVLLPKLMVINLVAWISAALCIFAPGSNNRLDINVGTRDFEHSLNLAWEHSFQYLVDYFLLDPLALVCSTTLFLVILVSKPKTVKYPAINPLLGLIYTYGVVFVLIFLVGYSLVLFIPNFGRIANMLYAFTAILFMLNTINLAYWVHNKIISVSEQFIKMAKILVSLLCAAMMYLGIHTHNYFTVWDDLYSGKAANYVQEFEDRLSYLDQRFTEESPPLLVLTKPFTDPPQTTFFTDITNNWDTWENYCFCSAFDYFYGKGGLFMLELTSPGTSVYPDPVEYIKLPFTPNRPPLNFQVHPSLISGIPPKSISVAKGRFNPLLKKLDAAWNKVSTLAVGDQGIAVYYDAKQHILIYKIKTSIPDWQNQQFFLELSSKGSTQQKAIQKQNFLLNGEKTFGSKLVADYFYYVRALPDYSIQMIKTGQQASSTSNSTSLWQKEFILIK